MYHSKIMKLHPTKLLVIFGPLIFLGGIEYILLNPRKFFAVFVAIIIVTVILLLGIIKPQLRQKEKIKYFILPFIYILSLGSFVTLLRNDVVAHIFAVAASLVYGWFLWVVFRVMLAEEGKQKQFYARFYDIFILVTFFLFVSSIYSWHVYLALPPWLIMILLFVISSLLFYEHLWFFDIMKREWWPHIIAFGFLFTQAGWVVMFWPISNLSIAFFLLAVFYALSQIMSQALTHSLNKKSLQKVLFLSLIVVLITLGTSQWTL